MFTSLLTHVPSIRAHRGCKYVVHMQLILLREEGGHSSRVDTQSPFPFFAEIIFFGPDVQGGLRKFDTLFECGNRHSWKSSGHPVQYVLVYHSARRPCNLAIFWAQVKTNFKASQDNWYKKVD